MLLAVALVAVSVGGVLALSPDADAAHRRAVKRHYYVPPQYSREAIECERAQHEDPTGLYAGYPCWAREAFSKGNRGGGRR
jgi:hypothetical protein